ncbi:hypothetical protein [Sphaerisporangium perillae]|uniref:hypothetical protein n=1 Tax=Sphaerisporangium perillae TaxID=2935860 RepID=UPI0035566C94
MSDLGDTEPLEISEPVRIDGKVRNSIIQVLQAIHAKAPNAKIMLVGYPRVIGATCDVPWGITDQDEVNWIKGTVNRMDDMMANLGADPRLQGVPVTFVDPRPYFGLNGEHGACTGDGNEAIHEVVTDLTPGDSALLPGPWNLPGQSARSFHPTLWGTDLYAAALNSVISVPGFL